MKTNKKYFLLSLATVVTVAGAIFGVLSFARTTPTLPNTGGGYGK
jgi:hypothetical protein